MNFPRGRPGVIQGPPLMSRNRMGGREGGGGNFSYFFAVFKGNLDFSSLALSS